MNKSELIDRLADRLGDKKVANAAVDGVLDIIERSVAKGEKVTITGFGSFEKVSRPGRMGRNPQTGEAVRVKKRSAPKFKAGTRLKQIANGEIKLGREPKHVPLLPSGVLSIVARAEAAASDQAPPKKAAPAKKTTAKKAAPAKKTTAKKAAPAKKTTAKKAAKKK